MTVPSSASTDLCLLSLAADILEQNLRCVVQSTNATLWCESGSVDTIFAPNVPCTQPLIQLFANLQPAGTHRTSYLS
jgi:hypothetical protein